MRKILMMAGALALFAAPAWAADLMAGYFGNTVISTGGTFEVRTHYRADHTFDMVGSMGMLSKTFKGTWAINDKGEVCRTFVGDAPPGAANPLCSKFDAHKVGDTWTVTSKDGSTRNFVLKAGVV